MSTRIEQIIDEIDDYLDSCKYQLGSNSIIKVDRGELDELIMELRMRVPEEIKKYQRIVSQQDAILEEARVQAKTMINDAQSQIDLLVSDHEVMQRAYQRANELVDEARNQADGIIREAVDEAGQIRMGAMSYTDGLLQSIQDIITGSAAESKQRFDQMYNSLQSVYNECEANRASLNVPEPEYKSFEEEDLRQQEKEQ